MPVLHQWQDDGQHWLLRRRCLSAEQQTTYYLVFAQAGTTLPQMVQAGGARWHIEEDFENGKDLGLDHYEVRSAPSLVPPHHPGAAGTGLLDRYLYPAAFPDGPGC